MTVSEWTLTVSLDEALAAEVSTWPINDIWPQESSDRLLNVLVPCKDQATLQCMLAPQASREALRQLAAGLQSAVEVVGLAQLSDGVGASN